MGIVTFGAPTDLVLRLRDRAQLRTFVETGTYHGETASWASEHFPRVVTIERAPHLHEAAKTRFAGLPHVECLLGDSRDGLARTVPTLTKPAIFWLDAHWCGDVTAGEEDECPLLDEIAVIDDAALSHVILVDDARLFLAPPPPPHQSEQWPSIDQVCHALTARGTGTVYVIDDVIVRVPAELRQTVMDYWLAQAASESPAVSPMRTWLRDIANRIRRRG